MADFNSFFKMTNVRDVKIAHPKWAVTWIHYTKLIRTRFQYADPDTMEVIYTLADAIEVEGQVLQNLVVRKSDVDQYEILAGHKRTKACQILVEERGLTQYEFLPCIIMEKNDVRAEFSVYTTNTHYEETPYQTMYRIERMKYLLENFPDQFPEVQGKGRMVEKLAQLMNKRRSMISDYQNIAHNLGEKAMERFQENAITKSAATALAGLEEEEQNALLDQGITSYKEIQGYKKGKKQEKQLEKNKTERISHSKKQPDLKNDVGPPHSEKFHESSPEELQKSRVSTCPHCKSQVNELYNRYYCGQCGGKITW